MSDAEVRLINNLAIRYMSDTHSFNKSRDFLLRNIWYNIICIQKLNKCLIFRCGHSLTYLHYFSSPAGKMLPLDINFANDNSLNK